MKYGLIIDMVVQSSAHPARLVEEVSGINQMMVIIIQLFHELKQV